MKLLDLLPSSNIKLLEAKARIEHPEDMIFDDGLEGGIRAYQILKSTAAQPEYVTIKFDGRPALIFGWRGRDFVLTDKAGFDAKGYDGMTTSPESLRDMIMSRKIRDPSPDALQQRQAYAHKISSLYHILRNSVPKTFKGFAQGDLLYVGTPPIVAGAYEFQPNKVKYRVPASTHLGEMIANSEVGMVIHSVFASQEDKEPEALRDVAKLGFRTDAGLAILPHEATTFTNLTLRSSMERALQGMFRTHGGDVRRFFDPNELTDAGIKSLPGLMKSYLAKRAESGLSHSVHISREFLEWLTSVASKTSTPMKIKSVDWINQHLAGYNATWKISGLLQKLKLDLKLQMDRQTGHHIGAAMDSIAGHEGFVSVTPHGMVKFVNRAEFMKKQDAASTLTEAAENAVSFAFARANPPTRGHQLLADTLAKASKGGDYYLFFSHSQDGKKNPLAWEQKLDFVKKIMPQHAPHVYSEPNIKTPLQAADWLYSQGYRHITFVAGEDRVESMGQLLQQWNSEEIRAKSGREAVELEVVSAGERDPDSDTVSGVSGTKAREAAQNDDFAKFQQAVGVDEPLAQQLFKAVKSGLKPGKKPVAESAAHSSGTMVSLRLSENSARQLHTWCKAHGVPCMSPSELHLTVLFSRNPVPHLVSMNGNAVQVPARIRGWTKLGDNALCLDLDCGLATKFHQSLRAQGGTHDWPEYIPHTSVSYDYGNRTDLPKSVPDFALAFDQIQVKEINPNYGNKA